MKKEDGICIGGDWWTDPDMNQGSFQCPLVKNLPHLTTHLKGRWDVASFQMPKADF